MTRDELKKVLAGFSIIGLLSGAGPAMAAEAPSGKTG